MTDWQPYAVGALSALFVLALGVIMFLYSQWDRSESEREREETKRIEREASLAGEKERNKVRNIDDARRSVSDSLDDILGGPDRGGPKPKGDGH